MASVDAVAIQKSGMPVLLAVPDPRIYIRYKVWLAQQLDRAPQDQQRDLTQAVLAAKMTLAYLPQFPVNPEMLAEFPEEIRVGLMAGGEDGEIRLPGVDF